MRLNKFLALATGMSRRKADTAIKECRVMLNGLLAKTGLSVDSTDQVLFDGKSIKLNAVRLKTIILNKPVGYVCSRSGQGSKTIYDLLPASMHELKPVGRLDKDSSGLILLTNDGNLANQLTHPKFSKIKVYEIKLDKALAPNDKHKVEDGVLLDDGISKLNLGVFDGCPPTKYQVQMHEGRNRQIRRTFAALGYKVTYLHRTKFGPYKLGNIPSSSYQIA